MVRPMQMLTPTIEELAKNYEGKALVGKVNVDDERALAQEYRIMSIPTLYFFKTARLSIKWSARVHTKILREFSISTSTDHD